MMNNFFEQYAKDFLSFSPSAIGAHYQYPATFFTEAGETVHFTQEQLISNIESLLSKYKTLDVGKIDFDVLDKTQLSNVLQLVSVLWHFERADGSNIYSAQTNYLLKQTENTFKIAAVIMVNESTQFSNALSLKNEVNKQISC